MDRQLEICVLLSAYRNAVNSLVNRGVGADIENLAESLAEMMGELARAEQNYDLKINEGNRK